jgi:hypothetical protein
MNLRWISVSLLGMLCLVACGETPSTAKLPNVRMALTNDVDFLRLAPLSYRQSLYRDLVHLSELDSKSTNGQLLSFPVLSEDGSVARPARALNLRVDLLKMGADAGQPVSLTLRDGEWSTDSQDPLYLGLDERTAADLVTRGWLAYQNFESEEPVDVERVSAPYAIALIEGTQPRVLVNPVFVNAAFAFAAETSSRVGENQ